MTGLNRIINLHKNKTNEKYIMYNEKYMQVLNFIFEGLVVESLILY